MLGILDGFNIYALLSIKDEVKRGRMQFLAGSAWSCLEQPNNQMHEKRPHTVMNKLLPAYALLEVEGSIHHLWQCNWKAENYISEFIFKYAESVIFIWFSGFKYKNFLLYTFSLFLPQSNFALRRKKNLFRPSTPNALRKTHKMIFWRFMLLTFCS